MHTLFFFSTNELRSLAAETLKQKKFKQPYEPNKTSTQKSFYLVKDRGIYLMNAFDRKTNLVAYASGFNPDNAQTDEQRDDLYDRQQDISRDDFAESIPMTDDQLERIATSKGRVTIRFSETQLEVIA